MSSQRPTNISAGPLVLLLSLPSHPTTTTLQFSCSFVADDYNRARKTVGNELVLFQTYSSGKKRTKLQLVRLFFLCWASNNVGKRKNNHPNSFVSACCPFTWIPPGHEEFMAVIRRQTIKGVWPSRIIKVGHGVCVLRKTQVEHVSEEFNIKSYRMLGCRPESIRRDLIFFFLENRVIVKNLLLTTNIFRKKVSKRKEEGLSFSHTAKSHFSLMRYKPCGYYYYICHAAYIAAERLLHPIPFLLLYYLWPLRVYKTVAKENCSERAAAAESRIFKRITYNVTQKFYFFFNFASTGKFWQL